MTAIMEAPPPAAEKIQQDATALAAQANAVVIRDDASYSAAGELLKGFKTLAKRIDETFDPIVKAAHAAWKKAGEQKKKFAGPVEDAERIVKAKISTYVREQEEIQRAERARLMEEQRKVEEERRLQEAIALENSGASDQAEEVLATPVAPAPIVMPRATPKVEGVSTRKVWRFEIENVALIPREYMVPDETKIGGYVRAMKEQAAIPGVRVYAEDVVSSRSF